MVVSTSFQQILSSVCACSGGGEDTVPLSIVIKVSMWWRCLINLLYYCHQCVRVVVMNTSFQQIMSSVCAWCRCECTLFQKYSQQCVRVMVVSTSLQQILTAVCACYGGEYIIPTNTDSNVCVRRW